MSRTGIDVLIKSIFSALYQKAAHYFPVMVRLKIGSEVEITMKICMMTIPLDAKLSTKLMT